MSKLNFDASKVKPQVPFETFPAGDYNAKIVESEVKPTTKGGTMIAFTAEIIEGEYAGRKVFDNINIGNSSAKAQDIGQSQLSALCHATGVIQLKDSEALHGIPFVLKVGIEQARTDKDTGTTYDARNRFKGFKPVEGGAPAQAGTKAPAWTTRKTATPPAPTTPPPAPEADTRKFYVHLDGNNVEATAEEISVMLLEGMPADTPVCLDGESDWKTAEGYEITAKVETAKTPPPPPKGPTTPPAPGGAKVPPWKRK